MPEEEITVGQAQLLSEDRARDARILPVVKAIYATLAGLEDLKMGVTPEGKTDEEHKEESTKQYIEVSFAIVKALIDQGVQMGEIKFLFNLASGAVKMIENNVNEIVNTKHDEVVAKFFGKEFVTDISVADIEQKLIENKAN